MTTAPRTTSGGSAVALAGGLLFVASLVYFTWSYLWRFSALPPGPAWLTAAPAVVTNVLLFTVFALHHSLFARTGLKAVVTRVVPATLERSVYVWIASLLFLAVCWAWQPVPGSAWHATGLARVALLALQAGAGVFTLVSARRLDVLQLAGMRQAGMRQAATSGHRESAALPTLDDTGPYGLVRHPIYLAWLVLVFAAPDMNGTRLTFAVVSSLYLVAAIPFEERDLRRTFGPAYEAYARRVRARLIPGLY